MSTLTFWGVTLTSVGVVVSLAFVAGVVQALITAEEHLKRHINEENNDE